MRHDTLDNVHKGKRKAHIIHLEPHEYPTVHNEDYPSKENKKLHEKIVRDSETKSIDRWAGGSLEDARSALQDGWAEGANKAKAMVEDIRDDIPRPVDIRRRLKYDKFGGTCNVNRMLNGRYNRAFKRRPPSKGSGPKVITIYAKIGGNANRSNKELFWQGAGSIALTYALEDAGYRVELVGCNVSYRPAGDCVNFVNIKDANKSLAIDTVASVLGHSAVFRHYGIYTNATAPWKMGYGWGSARPIAPYIASLHDIGYNLPPADIIMDKAYSRKKAIEQVKQALERLKLLD